MKEVSLISFEVLLSVLLTQCPPPLLPAAGNIAVTGGHSTTTEGGAVVISAGSGATDGGVLLLVSGSSQRGGSGMVSVRSMDVDAGEKMNDALPFFHFQIPHTFITELVFLKRRWQAGQ